MNTPHSCCTWLGTGFKILLEAEPLSDGLFTLRMSEDFCFVANREYRLSTNLKPGKSYRCLKVFFRNSNIQTSGKIVEKLN